MSVKTRVARAGVAYVVHNPTSRPTRFAARFVVRRLRKKVVASLPETQTRGVQPERVVVVAVFTTGAIFVLLQRRKAAREAAQPASSVVVPPASAPVSASSTPVGTTETPDMPEPAGSSGTSEPELVAPGPPLGEDDAALAARVEQELFGGSPALGISVEATAGVVTLRGQVADGEAEVRVVRDAEAVEGVKAVQSELETAGAPGPDAA